jgi:sister chromatid cohesion protein DCC1
MSSQPNTTTIPLSIAHQQSPIRLLELPPAILTLIKTTPAPTLQIKAAPSSSNHAVLCTSTQTFALRQVHSSNTTFLLTPSPAGVTATSTATSYLELLPSTADAKDILRPNLLPYPSSPSSPGKSKAQIARDVPVSDAEFSAAWQDIAAFEHEGKCYVPTATALLKAVKEAFTNAAAAGVRLEVPFEISKVIDEEEDEEEVPAPLLVAAMERLCTRTPEGWVLDRERCAGMVGRWVLQEWSEAGKGDLFPVVFLKMWKAAVPESCRGLCKLETLKVGPYLGKWSVGANGHRITIVRRHRIRFGLWRRERRRRRSQRLPPRGRRISGMKGLGKERNRGIVTIPGVERWWIGQYMIPIIDFR